MRPICTIAVSVALLTSFLQAPYFHLHGDQASDHAKDHHLAQALTFHAHWFTTAHGSEPIPNIERLAAEEDQAVFVAWTPDRQHLFSSLIFFSLEATALVLPTPVADYRHFDLLHSHDPPLVLSSAPRSPPV
ncbi:MAG: hypothetical protein HY647_08425 [Acidobacteria bacterium]|nr:hypothetical protein [Acidobacteriota bacterium]